MSPNRENNPRLHRLIEINPLDLSTHQLELGMIETNRTSLDLSMHGFFDVEQFTVRKKC